MRDAVSNLPKAHRGTFASILRRRAAFIATLSAAITFSTSARAGSNDLLQTVSEVRALTPAQAGAHLHAKLRGVIVGQAEPDRSAIVVSDETAGLYLTGPSNVVTQLRRGDLVEVEGTTDPGQFAPFLHIETCRKIGTRPIPEPRPVTFDQLIGGWLDAQWVEISGVVRRCETLNATDPLEKSRLELATGGGRLSVELGTAATPDELVDAEVRLRGLCFYEVNKNRQVLNPLLLVPPEVPVRVETPPPKNAFDTRVRSIASLLQFTPDRIYGHRVQVHGTVTHYRRGEALWICDSERGLRAQVRQRDALQPGDQVDVLGFPTRGGYGPALEDAVFRKTADGTLPPPKRLPDVAAAFDNDANLVQLDAQLTEVQPTLDGYTLTFSEDNTLFKAVLRADVARIPWRPGSRLRLAGICSVDAGDVEPLTGIMSPQAFQILLRSRDDVTLLQSAPWWSGSGAVWLLGGLSFGLLVMIGLVTFLARRRLREQAAERALSEAEFTAILKERNRMAREIHDTLAQGLGAISVQLELVKDGLPPDSNGARQHLEQAHTLVRSSLADARNSIWNMRSQVLETGDLASALDGILRQLTDGTGVKSELRVAGTPRRLPPIVENNLLRIGQEAITNAVRHGRPRNITVNLTFDEKTVRLAVSDDGCGFAAGKPPTAASDGGFGLLGMRERAAQLAGGITIESAPDRGTQVVVQLPSAA